MQALWATGEDVDSDWLQGGRSPVGALAAYQKIDGPFVFDWTMPGFGQSDNLLATQQALPALAGAHFPYTSTAQLAVFEPVARGADPDRIVAAPPRARWNGRSLEVVIPFGSDLDGDGTLTSDIDGADDQVLEWRRTGENDFQAVSVLRDTGLFSTTLDVGPLSDELSSFDFRVNFDDPDGVQGEVQQSSQLAIARSDVDAVISSTLRFPHAQAGSVELFFPAGALDESATFVYGPLSTPIVGPKGATFADIAFRLDAFRAGAAVPGPLSLSQPVSISLTFAPDQLPVPAAGLRLFYWDEEGLQWRDVATTCPPPSDYHVRSTGTQRQISVAACDLPAQAQVGLFTSDVTQIYLPITRR